MQHLHAAAPAVMQYKDFILYNEPDVYLSSARLLDRGRGENIKEKCEKMKKKK